ncbi:putative apoptosis-resistant E3 ubiquitin protein ligase 1 [Apostichopus japonicus]|uniref:HECT-type E3 ubiquitin transferase n=1 Tax=Stichopus japonicus TaxID=307972 RepID=A0A2G8KWX7_STIJA|nr:putative apoptosis-resistant E3 ubiquitin protein ligase 1 [Apostichopus japonicus]
MQDYNMWMSRLELYEFKTQFEKSRCFTLEEYSVLDVKNRKAFRDLPDAKISKLQRAQKQLQDELLLKQWLEDYMYSPLLQQLHSLEIWTLDDLQTKIHNSKKIKTKLSLSEQELSSLQKKVKAFQASGKTYKANFSNSRKIWNFIVWMLTSQGKVLVAIIVGGIFFYWVRGNNAAVSKYQSEKPDYLTILSGSVLDTNKTEVEWCIKEIAHVGGNLKFIIRFYQRNGFKCPVSKKDKITVEILSPQGPIPHSLEFSPEPQNNEVTVHAFTVKRAGIYSISVTVMHVHIKGSPFKKKFLAGTPDPKKTGLVHHSSVAVVTQNADQSLQVEVRDIYDNVCSLDSLKRSGAATEFQFKVAKNDGQSSPSLSSCAKFKPAMNNNYITLTMNVKRPGCYQASITYQGEPIRNGNFTLLVLSEPDAEKVTKCIEKKNGDAHFECMLLACKHEKLRKPKKVVCYISPKQLTVKEFYLKFIPKRLFTFRVCPATKFQFQGPNAKDPEYFDFSVDDGGQEPITMASKDRDLLAAAFTKFLLSNIGGSEMFKDKQTCFFEEVANLHSKKKGSQSIYVERGMIIESSMKATKHLSTNDWCKRFEVNFAGEEGLDWGGLTREWVEVLCTALFSPEGHFFKRLQADDHQGLVHPNPDRPDEYSKIKFYEFAGKLVGKCLYDSSQGSGTRLYVRATFTRSFLAQIIGLRITHHGTLWSEYYKTKVKYILENDITDMELCFAEDQYDSNGKFLTTVELIHNGKDTKVTNENKMQYLDLLAQHRLSNCVQEEIEAFLKGLNDLIPDHLLSIFDENELEMLLCGACTFSLDDLKGNHILVGSNPRFLQTVQWFWEIISSFTQEELTRLLQFTTGSSQLPTEGFAQLKPTFQIMSVPAHASLPTAHTCFNQLCLPTYDNPEQFHRMLSLAISEGSSGFGFL